MSSQSRRNRRIDEIRHTGRTSLASILFEDVEDDIVKAAKAGPAAVRKLANSYPDKKELKAALQGDYDKVEDDDNVNIGSGDTKAVGEFIPTQNEIDLMKSVAFPLGGHDALKAMVTSKSSTAPGAISTAGNEVLDGHHRWSGVWGISGKEGTIKVQDMGFKGDTSQKLAAAQLAIAAYKPAELEQPSAVDAIPYNILGKDKETIKKMILDNVGKQTDKKAPGPLLNDEMLKACSSDPEIAAWAGFSAGDSTDKVRDAIAEKVASNLSTLPSNPAAPNRADMPQFDHESMGDKKQVKSDIYTGLESGRFNVNKPFDAKDKKEESASKGDKIIMERWLRLAGLTKG
jgi:hypothetical protein